MGVKENQKTNEEWNLDFLDYELPVESGKCELVAESMKRLMEYYEKMVRSGMN